MHISAQQLVRAASKAVVSFGVVAAGTLLFAAPAFAGVTGSAVPDYPTPVTVGATGLPATLTIVNSSTGANNSENISVSSIMHTPSCGGSSSSTCTGGNIDTGVFVVHNGTGEAGTACAGTAFTASASDSSGAVTFTPGVPVVLGPATGALATRQCIIDFTVDVVHVPSQDANAAAGLQTDQLGSVAFQGQSSLLIGSASGSNEITVNKVSPSISTTLSGTSISVGDSIHDSATLSGATSDAGGTVTYTVFSDSSCSLNAVSAGIKPVTSGVVTDSNAVQFNAAGTYYWQAVYSGDANNEGAISPCQSEIVVVNKLRPTLTTTASAPIAIGGLMRDTAHLSGGANPTGTISFQVFAPGDTTCTAPLAPQPTGATAAGNGDYASGDFTAAAAGTYRWMASYAGDANNEAVATACNDEGESVVVSPATPSITTLLSASTVSAGTAVHDSSTITGATASAGGTVTYTVYTDAACSLGAVPAGTKNVTNGLVLDSDPVVLNSPGTYYWQAVYSGDSNNAGATSECGSEIVTVDKLAPALTTTLSATSIAVGGSVHDSATLSGATATAGGTATYTVYSDAACSLGAVDAGTKDVANGHIPDSDTIQFSTPGTYYWQVAYSGDASNAAAMSDCTSEIVTVGKATPSITTHLSATSAGTSTPVHDSATLSGATSDAGGTVTYTVYTDSSCSMGAIDAGTKAVSNHIVPDSDALLFPNPGTYYWQVTYSGDAKNSPATSPCTSEVLTITPPPPACPSDWKPVGSGWADFGSVVYLNRGGRLLKPNNQCPLPSLPLPSSPTKPSAGAPAPAPAPTPSTGRTRPTR